VIYSHEDGIGLAVVQIDMSGQGKGGLSELQGLIEDLFDLGADYYYPID
jgi:hypothetical protein